MRPLFGKIFLIIALAGTVFFTSAPKAEAFADPVTIALLAPLGIMALQQVQPLLSTFITHGGAQLLEIGGSALKILRLPLGLIQATLGAPFGGFQSGLVNIIKGGIAPFELIWDVLIFPLAIFGIGGG